MIDLLANESHFVDHLAAVYAALPPGARGSFMTREPTVAEHIATAGFDASAPDRTDRPVLVASYGDLKRAEALGRSRVAIMEHGAGQSYGGRGAVQHGSYAGGLHRDAASLFLHPGDHPAARDRKAYPAARVEVVGSPHLDTLPRKATRARTVAVTFHYNGPLCPETRSAYSEFFPAVAALAGARPDLTILGHGHPRLWEMGRPGRRLADRYREAGIEPVTDFADICRRADVLVFDNTSAGFAFAATGRPVVVMNSARYDRRVRHGLRFWEASEVGVNCDDPAALGECVDEALADGPDRQAAREAALDVVYAFRTGAARRAADVLMDWAA